MFEIQVKCHHHHTTWQIRDRPKGTDDVIVATTEKGTDQTDIFGIELLLGGESGLVSAFLSRGTNYVVSTLWSISDLPSSMVMMAFYLDLKQGVPASQALRTATNWLRNLTYAKAAAFHQQIYNLLPADATTRSSVKRNIDNAVAAAKTYPTAKPYSDPKYWAAFTISGWQSSNPQTKSS